MLNTSANSQQIDLRNVMSRLISYPQAAFIRERVIYENTIMAQEVFDSMKSKKGRSRLMATKLDMACAYDRME